jgi:hypothetical protein
VSGEIVPIRRPRTQTPKSVKDSTDTRMEWLWDQRLEVVGTIYLRSPDLLDVMAARTVLDATLSANLSSIELLLQRIEGGAVSDQTIVEGDSLIL